MMKPETLDLFNSQCKITTYFIYSNNLGTNVRKPIIKFFFKIFPIFNYLIPVQMTFITTN
jgi:hypothetical protein